MVEWAGISGDDSYYEWLKGIGEKTLWLEQKLPGLLIKDFYNLFVRLNVTEEFMTHITCRLSPDTF
jgi:hypothetical protein